MTLFLLPRMWYPLSEITDLNVNQINKCKIFNKDYIVYKTEGEDATWVCHTSICPTGCFGHAELKFDVSNA